jgi:hypothetical protein
MRQCIFCDNRANTHEHLWPQWILDRIKGPTDIHGSILGREPFTLPAANPEYKYKCVCGSCNHGWMSDLERETMKPLAALMQDIATPLDASQQSTLARWVVKTAMASEAPGAKHRGYFYTREERETLRTMSQVPFRTAVWLARYVGNARIGMFGTDVWSVPDDPIQMHSYVYTVFFNRVVIQLLTMHVEEGYGAITINPNVGPWDGTLLQIWPSNGTVHWPPSLSFTDKGPKSIVHLIKRWSLGQEKK